MEIFYETLTVGSIDTRGSELVFVYDPDWLGRPAAFPISLGMPLSTTPIGAERILPWLANLLPESHLTEIGQRIGVSPQDVLGLLARIGRDTAGALAIGMPRRDADEFRPIGSDAALARIIDELPQAHEARKPFRAASLPIFGWRLSQRILRHLRGQPHHMASPMHPVCTPGGCF